MLGLNAKDADDLLEGVALMEAMRSASAPAPSSISAADMYESAMALRKANKAIRVRNDALGELKGKFDNLGESYSDLSAIVLAQREVIDSLADQLAAKLGVDSEVVRQAAYKGLTKRYDARIGDMLSTGVLTKDPRQNPEVINRPTRDWYLPEL